MVERSFSMSLGNWMALKPCKAGGRKRPPWWSMQMKCLELTPTRQNFTILHYVLGDGTINDVRFQNFRGLADNRRAAFRVKQAVLENVYREPAWGVARVGEVIK